jgi:putative oxidoreductase
MMGSLFNTFFMRHQETFQQASLFIMRLAIAAIFIYSTLAKLPFWSEPFEGMTPLMHNLTRFLTIVEPLGAIALIVGFLTRWAAAGLGIIMAGAIVILYFTMGSPLFTSYEGIGVDYNFLLLAGCLVLLAFGGGKWSLDALKK